MRRDLVALVKGPFDALGLIQVVDARDYEDSRIYKRRHTHTDEEYDTSCEKRLTR